MRFHSLPGSKRHPESEDEYAIALDRYNTILDESFTGLDVFVVTMDWSTTPTGPAGLPSPRESLHRGGVHWWTEVDREDPDPDRQYLDKNPAGCCGIRGTGVELSAPSATDWGRSCPTGLASAPPADDPDQQGATATVRSRP
ncbi:hypothetical protein FEF34_13960 [Streptomyces marianii]|uniref:DUF3885 domain-containing protein n=1 Tax=Streptomyces marianii TaxID=1817406 RepID=A0A5R9EDV6_9ACTN|nr:hypothetical protein FEF34_13960 [Streptomyces marianii]